MDFAGPGNYPPPFLHTWSRHSAIWELRAVNSAALTPASLSFGTGNQARAVPMHNPWWYPVRRVFWINGSAVTGTRDFGIYTMDSSPRRVYSTGSQAIGSASIPQYVTPTTPFWLPPGDYYFIFNCTATTNAIWGASAITAAFARFAGVKEQAVGAVTIPDPFVPITPVTVGLGVWGVTWTASGF